MLASMAGGILVHRTPPARMVVYLRASCFSILSRSFANQVLAAGYAYHLFFNFHVFHIYLYALLDALFSRNATAGCYFFGERHHCNCYMPHSASTQKFARVFHLSVNATASRSQNLNAANASENNNSAKKLLVL
jgi:hypothetical protein